MGVGVVACAEPGPGHAREGRLDAPTDAVAEGSRPRPAARAYRYPGCSTISRCPGTGSTGTRSEAGAYTRSGSGVSLSAASRSSLVSGRELPDWWVTSVRASSWPRSFGGSRSTTSFSPAGGSRLRSGGEVMFTPFCRICHNHQQRSCRVFSAAAGHAVRAIEKHARWGRRRGTRRRRRRERNRDRRHEDQQRHESDNLEHHQQRDAHPPLAWHTAFTERRAWLDPEAHCPRAADLRSRPEEHARWSAPALVEPPQGRVGGHASAGRILCIPGGLDRGVNGSQAIDAQQVACADRQASVRLEARRRWLGDAWAGPGSSQSSTSTSSNRWRPPKMRSMNDVQNSR